MLSDKENALAVTNSGGYQDCSWNLGSTPRDCKGDHFPLSIQPGNKFFKPTRCLHFNLNFWWAGRAGWGLWELLGALGWGFCAFFLCPRHGSILSRESPADKKQKVERCSSTHDFDPTGKVLKFKGKKNTPKPNKSTGEQDKNDFCVVCRAVLFCKGSVGIEMNVGLILNTLIINLD